MTILPGDLVMGREVFQDEIKWTPNGLGLVVDRYYRVSIPYLKVLVGGIVIEYPECRMRRVDEEDREYQGSVLQG